MNKNTRLPAGREKLITELCPKGVEFKSLSELGCLYGGLTGKNKNDFSNGNAKFITYMNVFSNIAVNINITDFVKIGENENQNKVELGDVLFTGSSETPEECGMSSVLTEQTDEPLYLNSFCFGFRLNDKTMFLPDFLKYLFRCDNLRKQITQTASGVTRFNVSKNRMEKVLIPIPPIEIQAHISNILDKFTELEAELEAELETRKKQYEYYRDNLMVNDKWLMVSLGEVANVQSGGTPAKTKSEYWENGSIEWLGSTVCKNQKSVEEITDFITELGLKNSSAKILPKRTTLIAMVGATIGKVAFLDFDATTNQNVAALYPKNTNELNPDYLFYACQKLYDKFTSLANGKLAMANLSFIKKLEIPLPPLAVQNRIVSILDKFDKLVNDISEGLPAEIKMRRQQYEYYRNKLLNFETLKN